MQEHPREATPAGRQSAVGPISTTARDLPTVAIEPQSGSEAGIARVRAAAHFASMTCAT
jgi:hypothetical protein